MTSGMHQPQSSGSSEPALVDVVAALHHPLRRRLIEILGLDGPATVSQLSDATSERVGNISHHIKVLAAAGLVVEVPELAKDRRERWWRSTLDSISWSVDDVAGDAVGEVVVTAAEQQNLTHHVSKVQEWYASRDGYDRTWIRAAVSTDGWIAVTPDELEEFGRRVNALLREYGATPERSADPARQRVFAFAHAVPARA